MSIIFSLFAPFGLFLWWTNPPGGDQTIGGVEGGGIEGNNVLMNDHGGCCLCLPIAIVKFNTRLRKISNICSESNLRMHYYFTIDQ